MEFCCRNIWGNEPAGIVNENEDALLKKVLRKEERKRRQRTATRQIQEAWKHNWNSWGYVVKSAFPMGMYHQEVLSFLLGKIAKLGCVAFARYVADFRFDNCLFQPCVYFDRMYKENCPRQFGPFNSDSSVSHTRNCCFRKISLHSIVYIRR